MADMDKVTELTDQELEQAAGGYQYYTVKAGDNLTRIAKMYGTTWRRLAQCNHLKNPNIIHPGQVLKICY